MLDLWHREVFVDIEVDFYHVELGRNLRSLESCSDGSFVFPLPTSIYYFPNYTIRIALLSNGKKFKIFDNLYLVLMGRSLFPVFPQMQFFLYKCLFTATSTYWDEICSSREWKEEKGFQISEVAGWPQ